MIIDPHNGGIVYGWNWDLDLDDVEDYFRYQEEE
jgi:hypothetical protein